LLVSKERLSSASGKTVAIPGLMTTAYALLSLFDFKLRKNVIVMPFNKIIPSVVKGEAECGLIIHESRFTYKDYGLHLVADLGQWWEQTTGLPIPLGAIAAKRDIPASTRARIDKFIKASVSYANANTHEAMDYVRRYSCELPDDVIKNHIALYVNGYTIDSGTEGKQAIETLLETARQRGFFQADNS
ncbi:MAG: 1,4-dihydroxy-6-naphthoate synthase, partial [Nitrospirae bacterium]|nr:1,4-dihydroxy-6-naphthoate synthase [Nitrospirota bacterium]